MTPAVPSADARRARRWLALGAVAGVALAAFALLRGGAAGAPRLGDGADAVAWVDGEPISREAFARLAGEVARQRGELALDDATRHALLERLIDEELLLREGLALGLARREPSARRAIVAAVVEGVGAAAGGGEPDAAALEALYQETRERWREPGGLQVEAALVPVPPGSGPAVDTAARERALALAARVRSSDEGLAALAAAEGVGLEPPLPAAPLPLAALRARLAAPALDALAGLAPGALSEPVRSAQGWWLLRLVARAPDTPVPFDAVQPELRDLWFQRAHERTLRAHLDALRQQVEIEIAEPAQ